MEKTNFIKKAKLLNINISEKEVNKFSKYMEMLIEWNQKINLTAITEEKDIVLKHFIDSLTINKYLTKGKIMDIGTGAGFPSIPLKIINENTHFILVDSLNKRINFLNEVKNELELRDLDLIHARAEDLAVKEEYREKMDIVVSRAVANLSTLVEYVLPFLKIGGACICMKGPKIENEIELAQNAINILGGKIEKIEKIFLPESDIERNIVIIRKINITPMKYPRKAGVPEKKPL